MSLIDAIHRYTTHFNARLRLPDDREGQLLTRYNGEWASRSVVISLGVAKSDIAVDYYKGMSLDRHYPILDVRDYTLWTFENNEWVSLATTHEAMISGNLLSKNWLVASPYNHKFYYSTETELLELYNDTLPSGFHGEIPTSELITGGALASLIGLTAGTAINSDEPWLHFVDPLDGLTKYVAKKPYRHSISWDQLQAVNVVDGSRIVMIGHKLFKIRLMKGASTDPYTGDDYGYDLPGTWGSEWNRLMYHIHSGVHINPLNTMASEGITEGDWASYSDGDLVTHHDVGLGAYCVCQEKGNDPTDVISRGGVGISYLSHDSSDSLAGNRGWRPVLELVE